jgi:hypothetical protein
MTSINELVMNYDYYHKMKIRLDIIKAEYFPLI